MTPAASAYVRNAGLLPEAKAKADAARLVEVARAFEGRKLKGKCVKLDAKHGLSTLWNLVNEEGRGYFPPRSGNEVALYRAMKDAIAKGERLDPERVFEMSLEACTKNDEVSLQDALLTAHNVVRILARPETWWANHSYSRGLLVWTPAGDVELTRGRWEPGWRGMRQDPVFPIIEDIVGHAPIGGAGGRTLADIRGNTWDSLPPEQQEQHRLEVERRLAEKRQSLAAQRAALGPQKAERDKLAAEIEAARAALARPGPDVRVAAVRIQQMQVSLERLDAALAEAEAAHERLRLEIEDDITGRARDPLYTRQLFATGENAPFSHLYGAEEDLGNGGNWYYFWLGAFVYATEGTAAERLATRYEAAQKWLGSESEYARGLVQLSHFRGGAELGRQVWAHAKACPASEGLVEREYWDPEQKVLKREYQYVVENGRKVRHGFERRYYRSGVLEYEASRNHDALDGAMTRYWENGAKFDVAQYSSGHRQGAYEAFYHDGQPRAKGQFKGGRKVGPWTTWHPKGFKESEGSYLPDFYTVEQLPWENRASDDNDKGLYHGIGAKTGRWLYGYAGAEHKRLEETYDDEGKTRDAGGSLLGPRREWYDNEANSLMSEQLPSGSSTTFYENGQVESRCGSSGKCERYDRDGKRTQ